MNKFVKSLGLTLFGVSVAWAEPQIDQGPVELSATQMDTVTAGFVSDVVVTAIGISPVFAATQTDAYSTVLVNSTDQPQLGVFVGISGGEAQAVAVGDGSDTATSVTPSNNISAPNSHSFGINIHAKSPIVEIQGAGLITVGTYITNPL